MPEGGGVKVPTDTDGGWRGRVVTVTDSDGSARRIVAVRTWLPE